MSNFNVSTNEICCKIDHEGFRSDCLHVWFYKMPILTMTDIVKQKKTANSLIYRYTFNTNFMYFLQFCNNTLQAIELDL